MCVCVCVCVHTHTQTHTCTQEHTYWTVLPVRWAWRFCAWFSDLCDYCVENRVFVIGGISLRVGSSNLWRGVGGGGVLGGGRWNIRSEYTTHLGTAVACCGKVSVFEHLPTNAWPLLRHWVPVSGSQILSSSRTLWTRATNDLPAWWGTYLFFPPCYHCIRYFLPLLSYCSQIGQAKKHVMNTDSIKVYAKGCFITPWPKLQITHYILKTWPTFLELLIKYS